jgi:L-ascorbate metabolism protein UlaG (beta-lactamase superfamily)
VRVGNAVLYPQNMTAGADRIAFVQAAAEHINGAVRRERLSMPGAKALAGQIPLVSDMLDFVSGRGGLRARLKPGIEDVISFNPSRLAVCFPHGRHRTRPTYGVEVGDASPRVGRLCQQLRRGATHSRIVSTLGQRLEGVAELLGALVHLGVVTENAPPKRPGRRPGTRQPHLTWLGHASLIFESSAVSCWVDPWLPPRIEWQRAELTTLFSDQFADSLLCEPYGPALGQVSSYDLPAPDVVLITHQDRDHVDVGLLMTLPDSVQIIVPRAAPERPWEVDLERFLRRILGTRRKIKALGHGERIAVGDLHVTAFPFRGEMPPGMPHSWNCYLLEFARSLAACTADSDVEDETIAFLAAAHRATRKPLTLFASVPFEVLTAPASTTWSPRQLYNPARLHSWYQPIASLLDGPLGARVALDALRRLKRVAGLSHYFAYAVGSTPWFRLAPEDPFGVEVDSLSANELRHLRSVLKRDRRLPEFLPLKYGRPTPLGEA